jgi:parallel beta-helix repeat protein
MGLRTDRCGSTALAALAFLSLLPDAALAVTYRYASSENRIYVESGGSTTLTEIRANTPSLPAAALTRAGNVWLLSAKLHLEDGSMLVLHGSTIGGDVDELRLKSDGNGFVYLWAEYGTIDIDSTLIRSWNPSAGTVDTEFSTGRAFIRVRSFLDGSGVARESRMDIVNSEISHLGYNASESYGLVWKVIGSSTGLYDKVNVYGDIFGSNIHHNYFGMYTYGHEGGQWVGNDMHHNVKYGFDPHDDSDHLLIEDNDVHDNGNHGIIASQRCDHIVIRNNRSYSNIGNGIMIHRASDDALVENNESYLNTDSGVALFASLRSTVRGNTLLDNGSAGVRLSMGQADSVVENNEIGFSGKYGFYFYRGSDTPQPGDDGRPKRNTLRNNTVHDTASDPVKLTDGDANKFIGNTFQAGGGTTLRFTTSTATRLENNTIPSTFVVNLGGSSSKTTTIDLFQAQAKVQINDEYVSARFRDNARAIFDPDEALYTSATTSSSLLTLTRANTGGSSTVFRRKLNATPASGTVKVQPTVWATSKQWRTLSPSSSTSVAYTVGDLVAGAAYDVLRGSTAIGTFTASSTGTIAFSSAPGSTSAVTYTVQPD